MNCKLNVWNIISCIFGIAVLANGVLNMFWGNDFGLGVAFLIIAFIFFPSTNTVIKKNFGFSINYRVKIVLGILIIWITLAVGALAEGYYPILFN